MREALLFVALAIAAGAFFIMAAIYAIDRRLARIEVTGDRIADALEQLLQRRR